MDDITVYVLRTIYQDGDVVLNADRGSSLFLGPHGWTDKLSGATWFDTREKVLKHAFSEQFEYFRHLMVKDLDRWYIIEMNISANESAPSDDERTAIVRENALARLSPEEKNALGL
jgi:hypothetical protein